LFDNCVDFENNDNVKEDAGGDYRLGWGGGM
jgi:hypothetical protein